MTLITSIYDEIIEYYESVSFEDEAFSSPPDKYIVNGRALEIKSADLDEYYSDFLYQSDNAYILLDDYDRERIKRYLTRNFSYLMNNVLYINMRRFMFRNTYFINYKDAPIIKGILLRSVSQHPRDIIIGKWLKGRIDDNSYSEIVELSSRVFWIINETEADKSVKEQWINALSYALRSDLAYTITEVEFTLKDIFLNSLPFPSDITNGSHDSYMNHSQIRETITNFTNSIDEKAQRTYFQSVYEVIESSNLDSIIDGKEIPPVELLKLKSICEYLYSHEKLKEGLPNIDKIVKITEYFMSIDKAFENKLKERKSADSERYQRKKH